MKKILILTTLLSISILPITHVFAVSVSNARLLGLVIADATCKAIKNGVMTTKKGNPQTEEYKLYELQSYGLVEEFRELVRLKAKEGDKHPLWVMYMDGYRDTIEDKCYQEYLKLPNK